MNTSINYAGFIDLIQAPSHGNPVPPSQHREHTAMAECQGKNKTRTNINTTNITNEKSASQ